MPESVTDPTPPKKRRRWWRWSLRILLVLLLAFCIFRFVVHQRVVNRINAIRDAGYPVTLEELDAWYTYPDGPNAADVYQRAFDAYVGDEQFEETLPLIGRCVDMPGPGEKMPEDVAERVAYYLEQNAEAIALLEEASKIEGCRYPVDFNKGFDVRLPHIDPIGHGIKLMRLQIALDLDRGEYGAAVDHSITRFKLAQSLKNEPHTLSGLCSVSFSLRDLGEIKRLIQAQSVGDHQLQKLAQAISSIDIDRITLIGWVGERCIGDSIFIDPIESLDLEPSDASAIAMVRLWQVSGLWDLDRAFHLSYMQEFVDYAERPEWKTRHGRLTDYEYDNDIPKVYRISNIRYPNGYEFFRFAQKRKAKQAVILTAIAVERYRQRHGSFPPRIDDLIPDFLAVLPRDTIDDQMIQYRAQGKGTIIYSFGTDGLDNLGRPFNEEGYEEGKGSDISFTFGLSAKELWPPPKQKDDERKEEWFMYYEEPNIDEAYLKELTANGFPELVPRPADGIWPSESFDLGFYFENMDSIGIPEPSEDEKASGDTLEDSE